MKKYTTPELNVTKFDVEDVITTSIATTEIYTDGQGGNVNVANTVNFDEIFA